MSHQPYETWLLSDLTLSPDQETELKAHLLGCQQCQSLATAWAEVQETIVTSATPAPHPGFTQRWYTRLAIERDRQQQRLMHRLTLALISIASLILMSLALGSLFSISFSYTFSQLIARFSLMASQISKFLIIGRDFVRTAPYILPIGAAIGIGSLLTGIALFLLWLFVIFHLYQPIKQGVSAR